MNDWSKYTLEIINCPICGPDAGWKIRYKFDPFNVVTCNQCGLMYLSPRPDETSIFSLYQEQDYYLSSVAGIGYDEYLNVRENWLKTFRGRLKDIKKYKPTGQLLDVGCGPGFFLEAAQELGYDVWGIDPSEYIVQIAHRRFGERVRRGTIMTGCYEAESFDLIAAFDTFEHIYEPLLFLEAVKSLLKPNGVLVITTPNPKSLLACISGKTWVSFKIPEHVFYWSPYTIHKALEKYFDILEIRRAGQFATLGFLFRRLFNIGTQEKGLTYLIIKLLNRISFYSNNGSMTVIARKCEST